MKVWFNIQYVNLPTEQVVTTEEKVAEE